MANLQKRTYTIDGNVLLLFEKKVPAGSRSTAIAQMMRHWLSEEEKNRIRTELTEGLREMSVLYREESAAWYPLEEEVHEKGTQPQARRRRSRSL